MVGMILKSQLLLLLSRKRDATLKSFLLFVTIYMIIASNVESTTPMKMMINDIRKNEISCSFF
jgi:hypothetical protein